MRVSQDLVKMEVNCTQDFLVKMRENRIGGVAFGRERERTAFL